MLCGFLSAWTALLYLLAERTGFLPWRSEGSAPAGWMHKRVGPLRPSTHHAESFQPHSTQQTKVMRQPRFQEPERLLLPWAGEKPEPHCRG